MKTQLTDEEPNYIDFKVNKDKFNLNDINMLNAELDNNLNRVMIVVKSKTDKIEYQYFHIPPQKKNIGQNKKYNIKSNEAIASSVIYKDKILKRNDSIKIDNMNKRVVSINSYSNLSESENTLALKYNNEVFVKNKIKYIRVYINTQQSKEQFDSYINKLDDNKSLNIVDSSHYDDYLDMYLSESNINSYVIISLLILVLVYIYLYVVEARKKDLAILEILGLTKLKLQLIPLIEIALIIVLSLLISTTLYFILHQLFNEYTYTYISIKELFMYGGTKLTILFITLEFTLFYFTSLIVNRSSIVDRYRS
ncbi:MAG: FtsX-like permease family protein [Erysipelotrichales bacterium]